MQKQQLLAGSEKPAVVSSRVAAGPERSIVCTETASSSGSQRSCAAIGQSWKEGGGLSTSLPSPALPHLLPPPARGQSDAETIGRRAGGGCRDARRHIHRLTAARRLQAARPRLCPAPLALVCAPARPLCSPAAWGADRADSAAHPCDWEPSGG